MKKTVITMVALLITMCAMGQTVWKFVKADGTVVVHPAADVEYVTVEYHEYVDLGLPSGTLWAKMNIGATKPEDGGYYFAWGETATKDSFYENYKFGGSWNLTKYNWDSSHGTVDNKTELDLEDDAAYVNWGPEWRMPNLLQFEELINSDYTTTEWISVGPYDETGYRGYLITSKTNGNSIFLPVAGCAYGSGLGGVSAYGYYWSRDLNTYSINLATDLELTASHIGTYRKSRNYGMLVRPVKESMNAEGRTSK